MSMTFADGTHVSGITMSEVSFSMNEGNLVIKRKRPTNGTYPGIATTLAVVRIKDGVSDYQGAYVVIDGEAELTLMPYEGLFDSETEPGDTITEVSFEAKDKDGKAIRFMASLGEFAITITPQDEMAYKLAEARPDVVLALAIIELQKLQDLSIDDIEVIFFKM